MDNDRPRSAVPARVIHRRGFLRIAAASRAALTRGAWPPRLARAQARPGRTLKIGYVSPQTGPLAGFGEADSFVVAGVRRAVGKGLVIGDRTHPVDILVRD